ncbi:MAG TPA: DUF3592 domain-containing protein [Terriglobia bacterium]|nr:DUF3592 domain-containing protein [Terriglobia bacterium]
MNGWTRATVVMAAGGASGAAIATSFLLGHKLKAWVRARRFKSPEELERLRRLDIQQRGRIASAQIVDLIEDSSGNAPKQVVVYRYEVAGVMYEAAQDVSAFTEADWLAGILPGATSSVKYDPRKPGNSIIVCEDWSGLSATHK